MFMFKAILCFVIIKCSNSHENQFEGEMCTTRNNTPGVCTNLQDCVSAIKDIPKGIFPQTCSFEGREPIVCCVGVKPSTQTIVSPTPMSWGGASEATTMPPSTTVPSATVPPVTIVPPTTTERSTSTDGTHTKFLGRGNVEVEPSCPPVSPKKTAPKTGKKAWDKCIEYQEKLVYPCEGNQRVNYCWNDINTFILGGTDAFDGEFPHMALIGYGDGDELAFLCGGTLISDRFVLTAGHCSSSNQYGSITYVLLGALTRTLNNTQNLHRIRAVYKHPKYKPPVKYHDIALLETETPIKLNELKVPACLDLDDVLETGSTAVATGWGITSLRGDPSEIMQKVTLTKFSVNECQDRYKPNRLLRKGYDSSTQLCYGDRSESKDTCQGDSGGPLQIKNERIHCMYTIVGITSFGRSCGVIGVPALYTKVAAYIPWIESIVWPGD